MTLIVKHVNAAGQEYRIAWEATANRVTSFEAAGRAMAFVEQLCQEGHLLDSEIVALVEAIALRAICHERRARKTLENQCFLKPEHP